MRSMRHQTTTTTTTATLEKQLFLRVKQQLWTCIALFSRYVSWTSTVRIQRANLLKQSFMQYVNIKGRRGGSRIFFRRGCTRLLLYFNTNKPHFFFFLQNTSYIRKPQVISGRGAHPLHPPPRSAPGTNQFPLSLNLDKVIKNSTLG